MEMNDLRYFLSVAESGNVNQTALELFVAPSTLSKSISRLEAELEIKLFERIGRTIQITEDGRFLQKRAYEIIMMEESTRLSLSGGKNSIQIKICGEEVLFEKYGLTLMQEILKRFPQAQFQLISCSVDEAQRKIQYGEAHLSLTSEPMNKEISFKILDSVELKTYVSHNHPLIKKSVSIQDVLKYPFIIPERSVFGPFKNSSSVDGWREDKYPRTILCRTSSLSALKGMVEKGMGVTYMPEYLATHSKLVALSIFDCPFKCQQKVYLQALNPKETGWLNQIW